MKLIHKFPINFFTHLFFTKEKHPIYSYIDHIEKSCLPTNENAFENSFHFDFVC